MWWARSRQSWQSYCSCPHAKPRGTHLVAASAVARPLRRDVHADDQLIGIAHSEVVEHVSPAAAAPEADVLLGRDVGAATGMRQSVPGVKRKRIDQAIPPAPDLAAKMLCRILEVGPSHVSGLARTVQIPNRLKADELLKGPVAFRQRLHRRIVGAYALRHAGLDGVHGVLAEREHLVLLEPDSGAETYLGAVECNPRLNHSMDLK
jgi:hypothetical protein